MNEQDIRFPDLVITLNEMIKIICWKHIEKCQDTYEIMTQLFLFLITGNFSKPLVVYKGKTCFLDSDLCNKEILLPQAGQSEHQAFPQIVYADSRFIQRNFPNLNHRKFLIDYLKLLGIISPDEIIPEPITQTDDNWGTRYWQGIHILAVAADRYFNTFWVQQRGLTLPDIIDTPEYKIYQCIADAVYLFFSRLLPLSIPCAICTHHYLDIVQDFSIFRECIYQSRLTENWILSNYLYQIHNIVNLSQQKPSYPLEDYIIKKNQILNFIHQITEKSTEIIKNTVLSIGLDLKVAQDGTAIKWF